MMKKIGMGLSLIALAFFAFGVVQKGKIEENLTALLANSGVSVRHASINWLPSPNISLDSVQYESQQNQVINAEQIRVNLPWLDLLRGKVSLQDIVIVNGEFLANGEPIFQKMNGELKLDSLSFDTTAKWLSAYQKGNPLELAEPPHIVLSLRAENAEQDQFTLNVNGILRDKAMALSPSELRVEFHQKRLFNTDKLVLKIAKGNIDFAPEHSFSASLENIQVNDSLDLSSLSAQFNQTKFWQGQIEIASAGNGQLNIQFNENSQRENNEILLTGKNLNTKEWLNAFNIPALILGNADLNAHLWAKNYVPVKGEVQAEIENGTISGLNLLALISQYLPVNYDEETIKSSLASTTFDKVVMDFTWMPESLLVHQADIFHPYFIAHNDGEIELKAGHCDFQTLLALNNPRYKNLKLPIHFFGDCQSPQYQVKFDRTFRDQLKNFLKEKLK
ncbi:hypothetical protein [Pasteurella langaaensis]|nr:hypothetical protein [Pasteurella langaaensis]